MSNESTVHATLEAANTARSGKLKVYTAIVGDKTVYVTAMNVVRASAAAFLDAGGICELTAKAPKPMTTAELLAALQALPDAVKADIMKGLKPRK